MAQACSTFSRIEQSRFESFRRAAFPADAVSTYVAQCLIDEHYGERATTISSCRRPPILSELVAPGHAEEICIVVSTLAKAYAQRLVTAARNLAAAATSSSNNTSNNNEPIEPKHIMKAFQQRQGRGQDPGFFLMQAASGAVPHKTVLQDDEIYQRKRLAALKAQDDHDKLLREQPARTTKENAGDEDNKKEDDPTRATSMDIDSPAKPAGTET